MTVETFPLAWRIPLANQPNTAPVIAGDHVIVGDGPTLRAFVAASGAPAWTHAFPAKIDLVLGLSGGCLVTTCDPGGDRITRVGSDGQVRWQILDQNTIARSGIAVAGDRLVVSGALRDRPHEPRLVERRLADGTIAGEHEGWAWNGIVAIPGGWAWVDEREPHELRVIDAAGERALGDGAGWALAAAGARLYTEVQESTLRAYDVTRGLVWERPGGFSTRLAADEHGVVCGFREGAGDYDPVSIRCYDADGRERWRTPAFCRGMPDLLFLGDRVIASALSFGNVLGVAVLDRADGQVVALDTGDWSAPGGGITIADGRIYSPSLRVLACRRMERADRAEDAWPPAYLREVAKQLALGFGLAVDARAASLDELRAAVAKFRRAVPPDVDATRDALGWLSRTADWPLIIPATIADPDVPSLDRPDARVELVILESGYRETELWQRRKRLEEFIGLRYLALNGLGLECGAIGIALAALPRLAYLDLGENRFERVPPEVRGCRHLVHLDLRANRLRAIAADELPPQLRHLVLTANPISAGAVAQLRRARPDCTIVHQG